MKGGNLTPEAERLPGSYPLADYNGRRSQTNMRHAPVLVDVVKAPGTRLRPARLASCYAHASRVVPKWSQKPERLVVGRRNPGKRV